MIDTIKKDNLIARKNKDKFTSGILTCLIGEIEMVGKNNGNRKTTDEESIKVVQKFKKGAEEVYKVKPSEDVQIELNIYDSYLPKLMSEDKLTKVISDMIKTLEKPNIGLIMKGLKESKLQYDGKTASKITNTLLKGNK